MRARDALFVWSLAAVLVAALFALQSHVGLNLSDEGYLWYGAIHARAGEVPIRDFGAYDPGRYYWSAAWSFVFGEDIIGLRAGLAVFQAIGLGCGLLAVRRAVANRWLLVFAGVVLALWMSPRHKIFEPSLAMMAVWFCVRLLEQASPGRLWAAGVFTGLAAVFGRNHGVYCTLSMGVAIAWACRFAVQDTAAALLRFGAGIAVGFAPLGVLALLEPGFATAFVRDIAAIADRGVNIPHPIPWPWRIEWVATGALGNASKALASVTYLLYFAFFPVALWVIVRRRLIGPEVVLLGSAALVGVAYGHHMIVRSDLAHLAQSIHPALLGSFALVAVVPARSRVAIGAIVFGLLAVLTLGVAAPTQPIGALWSAPSPYPIRDLNGRHVLVPPDIARTVDAVREQLLPSLDAQDAVLFTPDLTALYPLTGRSAPVWNIYPLWRASDASQRGMIDEIEAHRVQAVVLRPSRGHASATWDFEVTHPLVVAHLRAEFRPESAAWIPPGLLVFRRVAAPARPPPDSRETRP